MTIVLSSVYVMLFTLEKAKGYLAAQVMPQPLGYFISYSHAIFVDLLITC